MSTPSIVEFFRGRSIFITGVTGFLGKVLLEKLLRSCHDLDKCYVLIRPKRGRSVTERLEELLQSKVGNILENYLKQVPRVCCLFMLFFMLYLLKVQACCTGDTTRLYGLSV